VCVVSCASDRLREKLLVVGALMLGGALARTAFEARTPLPSHPAPQRPVLFYNPKSGDGKAERFERRARAGDRAHLVTVACSVRRRSPRTLK
jgi:hypothetical protein